MAEPGMVLVAIRHRCDDVFARAPVTFSPQVIDPDTVVYQADPIEFARTYADSGIEEDYGPHWPPSQIDYWVEVRSAEQRVRVIAEGWQQREVFHALDVDLEIIAATIAKYFERLLITKSDRQAPGSPHQD